MSLPYHKELDGRYWLFMGDDTPKGGLTDLVGTYHTVEGVKEALGFPFENAWAQILDVGVNDPEKPWMNEKPKVRLLSSRNGVWRDDDRGAGTLKGDVTLELTGKVADAVEVTSG